MAKETIYEEMKRSGINRRQFLNTCSLIAASLGLSQVPFVGGKTFAQTK